MERFSEVVIQNDNITATGYSGFNFGKCEALQNSQQYFFLKNLMRCMIYLVFIIDLTINRTQLAENGIRFPDLHVSSKNDSLNVEDVSTFLELPKQDQKNEHGM